MSKGVYIYPSAKIWDPRNLVMDKGSTLGPAVDCYNVARVCIGAFATVSQRSYLCSASREYNLLWVHDNALPLIVAPIDIKPYAWIAAEVFVGPGVTISRGSVVLARTVAVKNTLANGVYSGNPMRLVKMRLSQFRED